MSKLVLRKPGLLAYEQSYQAMSAYTSQRDAESDDEIWCLEHPPVYTLGMAGKKEHVLDSGDIPLVSSDRGGQVTYHGPGQLVVYLLLNLKRIGIGIKDYVQVLEEAIIEYLEELEIPAHRRDGAPGVYVQESKIAALGIRVRRGCSYHGIALNVNMDLTPFSGINPCGYPQLGVTQLAEYRPELTIDEVASALVNKLREKIFPEGCTIIEKQGLCATADNDAA
ncbi:MAG: lipoyl(octanoyl) transferase LipB [Gammaproteobacteria bacterium]|nr:lipoyl(octanoyl) transferase LipB [Gammaproteobacteria bacterium]